MTAKELYDQITKHMTTEEALMMLLEGTVIEYQQLKYSERGKEIHPAILIAAASMEMGWTLAIPNDKEELDGMIIGTEDFIESIFNESEHNCGCGGHCCQN